MIVRILSAMVVIAVLYCLAVFLLPSQADELGDLFGIQNANIQMRAWKAGADTISEKLIESKNATGGILDNAKNIIDQARTTVDTTKSTLENKVEQAKKVYDSAQKTTEAISEFKSNVSDLASFSGVTASGSASGNIRSGANSSGVTSTGSNP